MKSKIVTISIVAISLFGLTFINTQREEQRINKAKITNHYTSNITLATDGKQLLETKCNMCHGIKATHDAMLAPPFINIQKKYKKVYKTKEKFVDAIVNFNLDPKKENAIMFGALKQFAVMPKMGNSRDDLTKIAEYIYNTKLESPNWCKN